MKKWSNQIVAAAVMLCLSFGIIGTGILHNQKSVSCHDTGKQDEVTLTLWYGDTKDQAFWERTVSEYEAGTGRQVEIRLVEEEDYIGAIGKTKEKGPDLYLADQACIQKIVRLGIAAKTAIDENYTADRFREGTFELLKYQEEYYGYPLGFDVTALMYRKDQPSDKPSLTEGQPVVPISFANITKELNASDISPQQMLLWDSENFADNYGFLAAYANIGGTDGCTPEAELNSEELIHAGEAYQKLAQLYLEGNTYTYADVKEQFAAGNLKYAIVHADVLSECQDWEPELGFASLPALNDTLKVAAFSESKLLMVNECSGKKTEAEKFAKYASVDAGSWLYETRGFLPLVRTEEMTAASEGTEGETVSKIPADKFDEYSEVFYVAYETSVKLPKLADTMNYRELMQETLRKLRDGANVRETFEELQKTFDERFNTKEKE